jgi:hypothetical protein
MTSWSIAVYLKTTTTRLLQRQSFETCSEGSGPVSAINTAPLLAVSFAIHSATGMLGSQNSISGEENLMRAVYGFEVGAYR